MPSAVRNGTVRVALGAALACTVLLATMAPVAAAAPPHVSVGSVDVSDDEPVVGDTITVTPTIRHSSSGSGSFEVTQVTVTDASGTRHATASDLGTLGTGDSIEVPLTATPSASGHHKLTVHVRGVQYNSDGRLTQIIHTKRPTYVSVWEPSTPTETDPRLNVESDALTVGSESTVRVVASNGGDDELTDLSVRLHGLDGTYDRTKLRPALGTHNSSTFEFDVRPTTPGEQSINATLQYGDGETVTLSKDVTVRPLREDVTVHATAIEQNDSTVLRYRVNNHGNAPIENVVLSGATVGSSLPTTVISKVPPGTSDTSTVAVNDRPSGSATVTATYRVATSTGQADGSVRFADAESDSGAGNTTTSDPQTRILERNVEPTRGGPLEPVSLLTGGLVATSSIFGYRNWRRR
ncbi:hypothetical protein ACFQAS_12845 [Halopenitus salinus]|uniref:CARDB domain-containing protein n=1 Tax=Halopenitus salinus TaxID=1198295 RepID=A0ABD5UZN9_9EURY